MDANQTAVANVRLPKTRNVDFVDFCGESKQHVDIWGNGLQLHSVKSALYGAEWSASRSGYFTYPFNEAGWAPIAGMDVSEDRNTININS
jgi:hypothetical protein